MRHLIFLTLLLFSSCDLFPTMDVEDILCDPNEPQAEVSMALQSIQCGGVANSRSNGILFQIEVADGVVYYVVTNQDPLSQYDGYTKFQADPGYTNQDTFYISRDSGNVGNTKYVVEEINPLGVDSFEYVAEQFRDTYKGHFNNLAASVLTSNSDQRRRVIECESWVAIGDTLFLVTE